MSVFWQALGRQKHNFLTSVRKFSVLMIEYIQGRFLKMNELKINAHIVIFLAYRDQINCETNQVYNYSWVLAS